MYMFLPIIWEREIIPFLRMVEFHCSVSNKTNFSATLTSAVNIIEKAEKFGGRALLENRNKIQASKEFCIVSFSIVFKDYGKLGDFIKSL